MAIVPDTKDWTFVLERPCPECGFDTRLVRRDDLAPLIGSNAAAWQDLLGATDAGALRVRPSEDRWSTLEYACHVRDVFRVFGLRLHLMVETDSPTFANWDQDATALEEDYPATNPAQVATELGEAAAAIAAGFGALAPEAWARGGTRGDGAVFTLETLGRYLIHDPVHHLYDVGGRPS